MCACPVVSNSLRSHGLQPTRLLCPWNFTGKITGVGCQFPMPRDLPDTGIGPTSLASPTLAGRFFTTRVSVQFSSVTQSCPTLWDTMDCSTPGLPVHHQLPSLLKLMSIDSMMPSNHLILHHLLLLLPSIFPSIRVFSNESVIAFLHRSKCLLI